MLHTQHATRTFWTAEWYRCIELSGTASQGESCENLDAFMSIVVSQGGVDFQSVKNSGISFAFAKATEGTSYVDPTFANNWQNMLGIFFRSTDT
jgi:hypothetical protein